MDTCFGEARGEPATVRPCAAASESSPCALHANTVDGAKSIAVFMTFAGTSALFNRYLNSKRNS
jgi:hypothetical protein